LAYREVALLEVEEVVRLWLRGRSIRLIVRRTGVARNTVRSYLVAARAIGLTEEAGEDSLSEEALAKLARRLRRRPPRQRGESWAKCEQQRKLIEDKLKQGLRLTKIRKLLRRLGCSVPYATLHRFAVSELDFGRSATTIPVADCEPGEELQVDTGWMGYLEPDEQGRRRRFRAFIFTAVRSRHRFVYPCLRETTEVAIEACEAAWEFYGGIFRVLIPDNTKAIVQTYDPLRPILNPAFLEYGHKRGFEVDPTRRRSPRDKGRVERAVRHVRDDCFAGERIVDIAGARRLAENWCLQDYGMRRHTRTQRMPLEHFETEEKSALQPAPTRRYDIPQRSEPKVGRDQHVQVLQALYSVPKEFEGKRLVGRKLVARADRSTVRLYADGILVRTHPRKPPGGRSTDRADFAPEKFAYASRDAGFLLAQAKQHGDTIGRLAELLLAGPLPWTRMRQVYALLGLCKRYGDERVERTCVIALEAEMHDVRRLERMLQNATPAQTPIRQAPLPSSQVLPFARYLRPSKWYQLSPPPERTDNREEP
jgi:transposase